MRGTKILRLAPALLLAAVLPSCATARGAGAPAPEPPAVPPASTAPAATSWDAPLLLDPSELGFGTSVEYTRIPNARDIAALAYVENVRHIIVTLRDWPEDYSELEPLARVFLPPDADLIVVLQGYPPERSRASIWNLVHQPLRIMMLVDGPPVDRGLIQELNAMHGLERVIATMEHPARSGFERLQRPLSFRVLMP